MNNHESLMGAEITGVFEVEGEILSFIVRKKDGSKSILEIGHDRTGAIDIITEKAYRP